MSEKCEVIVVGRSWYERVQSELAEAQSYRINFEHATKIEREDAAREHAGEIVELVRQVQAERERTEKARDGIIQIGMAVGVHDASSVEQILEDVAAIKQQAEQAEEKVRAVRQERDALTQERDSLRLALIQTGRNIGCILADDVSSAFIICGVPAEAKVKVEALQRELDNRGHLQRFDGKQESAALARIQRQKGEHEK